MYRKLHINGNKWNTTNGVMPKVITTLDTALSRCILEHIYGENDKT